MTAGLSTALDRLTPDDPFALDWDDVDRRAEAQMQRGDTWSPRFRTRIARRGTVAAIAIALFIVAPVTAVAVRLLIGTVPTAALMFSDPLYVPVPKGGSGAGGSLPFVVGGVRRVAHVVFVADYPIRHSQGFLRSTPEPPPQRYAIVIRHFHANGTTAQWPVVNHLQLQATTARHLRWHVRLRSEAVEVEVRFGSKPDASITAAANAILLAVNDHNDHPGHS
jgi:hypothetical protein